MLSYFLCVDELTANPFPRSVQMLDLPKFSSPVFFRELDLLGFRLRTLRHCRRTSRCQTTPGCDLVVFPASSQQGWDNSRSPKSTRNRNTNHEIAKECVPSVMKTVQHCPSIHLYVSFHPSFYHLLPSSIYSSLSLSTFKYFSIHSTSIPASISTKKMHMS